jgi:hypothetical protein
MVIEEIQAGQAPSLDRTLRARRDNFEESKEQNSEVQGWVQPSFDNATLCTSACEHIRQASALVMQAAAPSSAARNIMFGYKLLACGIHTRLI